MGTALGEPRVDPHPSNLPRELNALFDYFDTVRIRNSSPISLKKQEWQQPRISRKIIDSPLLSPTPANIVESYLDQRVNLQHILKQRHMKNLRYLRGKKNNLGKWRKIDNSSSLDWLSMEQLTRVSQASRTLKCSFLFATALNCAKRHYHSAHSRSSVCWQRKKPKRCRQKTPILGNRDQADDCTPYIM